jgi:hypothetical protein
MNERDAASVISRYFLSLDDTARLAFLIGLAIGRDRIPNSFIVRLIGRGDTPL